MNLLARFALPLAVLAFLSPLQAAQLQATADAWVNGAKSYVDVNYGAGEFLQVRTRGRPRIALIQFDTSTLQFGSAANATLFIHVSRIRTNGTVRIQKVISPWSEGSVTFTTRPTIAAEIVSSRMMTSADNGSRVAFDISSLVAQWISDPASNFGLAITGGDANTEVYFGSQDAGTPPRLRVTAPNTVTVSKNGGDYDDPIAAAESAFSGDTWCVNPAPPDASCLMNIDEGIFILSKTLVVPAGVEVRGADKGATVLIAARGLELAVDAVTMRPESTGAISDLTIINRQDSSVGRSVGVRGASLTRVAVRAEGALHNAGVEVMEELTVTDSDISAAGGQSTTAIDGDTQIGYDIHVHSSRVSATGGSDINIGVDRGFDRGGRVSLTDTVVLAIGGNQSFGLRLADENATFEINGGTITASAQELAIGVDGGDFIASLSIDGARIVVTSPGDARGVSWHGAGVNDMVTLNEVFVHSSGVAVSRSTDDDFGGLAVLNSQLIGTTQAILIDSPTIDVRIDRSLLQADQWAFNAGRTAVLTVSDSVLDGTAGTEGVTATCARTLAGDYQPLGSDCLPQ